MTVLAAALPAACRLAAERGAVGAAGPGSLRVGLLDNLYQIVQAVKSSDAAKQQVLVGLRIQEIVG
jgi:hydroxyethylthiazole kinase-like sugar kinase family protein